MTASETRHGFMLMPVKINKEIGSTVIDFGKFITGFPKFSFLPLTIAAHRATLPKTTECVPFNRGPERPGRLQHQTQLCLNALPCPG